MTKTLLDDEKVFTIAEFLAPEECAAFVAQSEAIGYGDALLGGEVVKSFRDNERVLHDDPALAERLFLRAQQFLPPVVGDRELVGFNERFRFYRYGPGQTFKPHLDGAYYRIKQFEVSELTFMVYLNDDFTGGHTNFCFNDNSYLLFGGLPRLSVNPVRGTALVFPHRLWHEGGAVETGRKYVLRTDVMYGPSAQFGAD